jgi:hypothetical protein
MLTVRPCRSSPRRRIMTEMLRLLIGHRGLSSTLQKSLDGLVSQGEAPPAHGDVVVSTTADISPNMCRGFAKDGVRVVVIAIRHDPAHRQAYEDAGAYRYLEMFADAHALSAAVKAAIAVEPEETEPTAP